MLENKLKKRIEKLEHKKIIFAALHRGGSSVFDDIVLHIIKLKYLGKIDIKKSNSNLTSILEEVSDQPSFCFRVDTLENEKVSNQKKIELIEKFFFNYYSMYRVSTDLPVLVMEEFIKTKNTKVVLLIRDVRDCMCSGYYSFNLLHGNGLEDANQKNDYLSGIDRYVLDKMVPKYNEALKVINRIKENPENQIFRYEDMIKNPKSFVAKICEIIDLQEDRYELAWNLLSRLFDYQNISYDETKHMRQVFPGNYKKELKETSIITVNNAFQAYLEEYGYL